MAFVHLHRHSEFSRLDGIGTAKQYAEQAAKHGQFALAQTDHGTMSGALHHIEACKQAGILPISGVEAYFRPLRGNKMTRQAWHLCLFAKNLRGWHNLMRIVTVSNGEIEEGGGYYQKPCVDFQLLREYREGIICSTACISSWLSQLIDWGDSASVREYMTQMLNIYGEDLFIEIMPHDFDEQRTLNLELVRLAHEYSIPLIATNDAHFPYKEWAETHRVAKIMGSGKTLSKVERDIAEGKADYLAELNPSLYLCHEEEMLHWFQKHHPQISEEVVEAAMSATGDLVAKTTPFLLDQNPKLPHIPDLKTTTEETLEEWIEEGLAKLRDSYPEEHWESWPWQDYIARVKYEFKVLSDKGVIDYFVMLGDTVRWARSQGIRVGLGRGSAAGCLISYLVGITAIDPISYGLLFERFINPERKGMPDIDIDFDSERRSEVKAYLADKYGADHVADIVTHQRFQPKKLVGDLSRVYGVPLTESRMVMDSIDIRQDDEETTLEEILPLNEKLAKWKTDHPEIWQHALRLEGTVANAGKHAAGIIVTPKPIQEYMALERGKKDDLVTSWSDAADFQVISDYGLMKYDFLGLTGLSKHEYACQMIYRNTGKWVDLNALPVLRSPYEADPEVLRLFAEGYTHGLFQFASTGITKLLRDIQPDTALDLIAANALYRPGPLKGGVTWEYPARKHDEAKRHYWHESVKPILEETYGVIAFQEQVMEIGKRLGGFSGGQADDLRKAMGKLYRIKGGRAAKEFMGRFEEQWFREAPKIVGAKTADEIWHKMLEFGHYGFNKSHSACYSLTAYQDGHLKTHYPAYHYAAELTYQSGKKDDLAEKRRGTIRETKMRGIEIVLPDINSAGVGYEVDSEGRLILGLTSIKGVGDSAAQKIIDNRPYRDFSDVLNNATKLPILPLLQAGACSGLIDPQYMLSSVRKFLTARAEEKLKEDKEPWPEWTVFEHLKHNQKLKTPREVPEIVSSPSREDLMALQGDILSLPVASLNMTDAQQEYLARNCFPIDELSACEDGDEVMVGGEITRVVRKTTKKGDPFATVTLVFGQNVWAVKFWSGTLAQYGHLLTEGKIVVVSGKKDEWNGYLSVVAKYAEDLEALDVEAMLEKEKAA